MLWLAILLSVVASGCGHTDANHAEHADSTKSASPARDPDMRIVSFSPAITRTLVALDLQEHIVGRTRFCRGLDRSIPVVGDLRNVDYERLIRLQPTHIFLQPEQKQANQRLIDLADERNWQVHRWPLTDRADIRQHLRELPEALDLPEQELARIQHRAQELIAQLDQAFSLDSTNADTWQGRVLLVAGVDPVWVAGRSTYLSDLLESTGCENAVPASDWPSLSLEDVVKLDPEAVIILTTAAMDDTDEREHRGGSESNESQAAADHALQRRFADLPIEAARADRIAVLGHPDWATPSIGLIDVAAELRDILQQFATAGAAQDGSAP